MGSTTTNSGLDVTRPFTRQQALDNGITERQLRGSAYRRLHTGIYIATEVLLTPELRAEAVLLPFGPRAFASHATAARLWRLPIPALPDDHVTVLQKRERRSRSGIRCHYAPSAEVYRVGGVRFSGPAQVFVELGTQLALVDLVAAGDRLVRDGRLTLEQLRTHCERAQGPGASSARMAATYAREGVDSPMETRLRMLLALAGLPEPRVNAYVGESGVGWRKYDLCWPDAKLIVEYDGRHHIEREEQWEADLERREGIDDDGWRIIVVTSRGIYRSPGDTVAKLHRLLAARGAAGVPARPADAWRLHFPGRD